MYRYRLVDVESGSDLGAFVSMRLALQVGETFARAPTEWFVIENVVAAEEHENFRSYLIVQRLDAKPHRDVEA
jgi:hypothetical protein